MNVIVRLAVLYSSCLFLVSLKAADTAMVTTDTSMMLASQVAAAAAAHAAGLATMPMTTSSSSTDVTAHASATFAMPPVLESDQTSSILPLLPATTSSSSSSYGRMQTPPPPRPDPYQRVATQRRRGRKSKIQTAQAAPPQPTAVEIAAQMSTVTTPILPANTLADLSARVRTLEMCYPTAGEIREMLASLAAAGAIKQSAQQTLSPEMANTNILTDVLAQVTLLKGDMKRCADTVSKGLIACNNRQIYDHKNLETGIDRTLRTLTKRLNDIDTRVKQMEETASTSSSSSSSSSSVMIAKLQHELAEAENKRQNQETQMQEQLKAQQASIQALSKIITEQGRSIYDLQTWKNQFLATAIVTDTELGLTSAQTDDSTTSTGS